jgi:hypothetical protein
VVPKDSVPENHNTCKQAWSEEARKTVLSAEVEQVLRQHSDDIVIQHAFTVLFLTVENLAIYPYRGYC